jgi:hypothetical protein
MFYPVVISSGNSAVSGGKESKIKEMPDVKIENGKIFIYKVKLAKKGNFKELDVFKKGYIAFDLNVTDLLKSENYIADKTVFKNNKIIGYVVRYKNKDIKLNTDRAVYDKNSKMLNGDKFELYSKNFKGYGKSFKIDENKNLYANNITYYLKVEK